MKRLILLVSISLLCSAVVSSAEVPTRTDSIPEVVVTGVRSETDVRHLSQTVSVISRTDIEQTMQPSLLPILTEQVPLREA